MPSRPAEFVTCPRCTIALDYVGTRRFHEGTRAWAVPGGVWELFKNLEHYDVYVCNRCGRVEFFVDSIGEELRNERPISSNMLAQEDPPLPPADPPPPEDLASAEPIPCLQCGAVFGAGESKCAACGWSYGG